MSLAPELEQLVPTALLRVLQERFPDRAPDLNLPDREVWFRAGQVSVVKFLQAEQERLREEGMEGL